MGINMGIEVLCYPDLEPKMPDPEVVEAEFFDFLRERFPAPEGGPTKGCLGGGWVSRKELRATKTTEIERTLGLGPHTVEKIEWDFDVRPFSRGAMLQNAGFTFQQVYAAIFEFIMARFDYDEGFDCRVYWSA